MQKRGQSEIFQLNTLFELLAAFAVAAVFVLAALNFSPSTKFDKKYIEDDVKFMINTVLASPGNMSYNYTYKEQYEISISEKSVDVVKDIKITNFNKNDYLMFKKKMPLGKLEVKHYD